MINSLNSSGNSSVIKFGGWDIGSLTPGNSLQVLRTKNEKSWTLLAGNIMYNKTLVLTGVNKEINLSPHLPYLYIPDSDWTLF